MDCAVAGGALELCARAPEDARPCVMMAAVIRQARRCAARLLFLGDIGMYHLRRMFYPRRPKVACGGLPNVVGRLRSRAYIFCLSLLARHLINCLIAWLSVPSPGNGREVEQKAVLDGDRGNMAKWSRGCCFWNSRIAAPAPGICRGSIAGRERSL